MAKYQLTRSGCLDTEHGHHIPDSMDNRHWREYLEWLAEGNVPDPAYVPPPPTAAEALHRELMQTDQEMMRGFDWLMEYLVGNGTVLVADIPQKLKALYQARKALRNA